MGVLLLGLLVLTTLITTTRSIEEDFVGISRDDFPKDFVFGSGTSAYQVEGAAAEDGRTPSVWDTFAHAGYLPGTGDIAADEYHKYKEDVELMEETGLDGYRFSISWSRLIPNGRGRVNPKGLEYYNNLINELISHGIRPHVTLFHYDLPQVLEDEYSGWLSPKIVGDFTAYADVCFREFGDRIAHWTTLNEPNALALGGYDIGIFPPGRCSQPFGNCTAGNSTTEPYIAAHHCLLAHSAVVSLYRKKYQVKQGGFVGINVFIYYFLPFANTTEDVAAAIRAQEFYVGWIMDPLYHGDYPNSMRKMTGNKMPKFSRIQSQQLIGSFDFIGVNYYATLYVKNDPHDLPTNLRDFTADSFTQLAVKEDAMPAREFSQLAAYGLQGVLEYFKLSYGNPTIYIHENGYPSPQNVILDDGPRITFMSEMMKSLLNSLWNGSNTVGYFSWSFIDVYELMSGYEITYGLYYVNFSDKDLLRSPRLSAYWYANFLKRKGNSTLENVPSNPSASTSAISAS